MATAPAWLELGILRAGDTLVVWKLDRLGRSLKHLVDLVAELRAPGTRHPVQSLTDSKIHSARRVPAQATS